MWLGNVSPSNMVDLVMKNGGILGIYIYMCNIKIYIYMYMEYGGRMMIEARIKGVTVMRFFQKRLGLHTIVGMGY